VSYTTLIVNLSRVGIRRADGAPDITIPCSAISIGEQQRDGQLMQLVCGFTNTVVQPAFELPLSCSYDDHAPEEHPDDPLLQLVRFGDGTILTLIRCNPQFPIDVYQIAPTDQEHLRRLIEVKAAQYTLGPAMVVPLYVLTAEALPYLADLRYQMEAADQAPRN
jgi:hypothetical protein